MLQGFHTTWPHIAESDLSATLPHSCIQLTPALIPWDIVSSSDGTARNRVGWELHCSPEQETSQCWLAQCDASHLWQVQCCSSSSEEVLEALGDSSCVQPRLGMLQLWLKLNLPRQSMQDKDGGMSKVLEMEEQKGSACGQAGKEITF